MNIEVTPVFEFIYDNYLEYKDKVDKIILYYAQKNRNKKIRCGRSKMTWTIDSIWSDWKEYLQEKEYVFKKNESKHHTTLYDNKFIFIGADDPQKFHGPRQDVLWFNEAMELAKESFDQINQRTNELIILDYNPSALKHWIFTSVTSNLKPCKNGRGSMKIIETLDEKTGKVLRIATFFDKSTFLDNPFLPAGQRQIILGYNPWHPEDANLPEDERRDHPTNHINGTADKYMWLVYGMGVRAQDEATIYKKWELYDEDPEDYDTAYYGLDFGFTNDPTAIVQILATGKRRYVKELLYLTGLTNPDIAEKLKAMGINWEDNYLICDSAEQKSIIELRKLDIAAIGAMKGPGSVRMGINKVREYKLFIHKKSLNLQNEISSYKFAKEKDGTLLNEPIDKNNHLMDALRYALTRF